MSRYYNQLRSAYQVPSETAVAAPPAALESATGPEATATDKPELLPHREELSISAVAGTRLILGEESEFAVAADSYRALRTRLVRLMAANGFRSVVISSPVPAEGKTLTTMNLGLTFARLEKQRVLLVDADLHTSGLSRLFDDHKSLGLQDVLQGEATFESILRSTNVRGLYVVTAGSISGGTAEAFANQRWKQFMDWAKESFDVVLVDTPPILAMADFELIAAGCDSALLVVRALETSREMLGKAVKLVDAKKLLGLVFNRSTPQGQAGYYGYGAYGNATS